MEQILLAATGALGIPLLVKQLIDFVRYLRGGQLSGAVTIVLAWLVGIAFITLFAHSDMGDAYSIDIGNGTMLRLSQLGGATLVLLGAAIGAIAGGVTDVVKAVDNTQSAAKPSLLAGGTKRTE